MDQGHSVVHPGFEFNHMADVGAKWGCLGFSTCRRQYTFQFVEDQLAWLAAVGDSRPVSIIDASSADLYGAIKQISDTSLDALRAEMPRNSTPAQPYFDAHCHALLARRQAARQAGATVAQINEITDELKRAARKAK